MCTVDFQDLAFLMCQPSSHMLRTNANQAQLKMIVDYPGPGRVLLEVLQPLSHGSIRARLPVSSGFYVYALIIAHPACTRLYCTEHVR